MTPHNNAHHKNPIFKFATENRQLTVTSGTPITVDLSQEKHPNLWDSPNDTRILCGIIPFDITHPSTLYLSDNYTWAPRQRTTPQAHPQTTTPTSEPPHDNHYLEAVSEALNLIRQNTLGKIVLARQIKMCLPHTQSAQSVDETIFTQLLATSPTADVFSVHTAEDTTWLGASPEIIADCTQGIFTTRPLAGSLSKETYPDPATAQQRLTSSTKDLHEHRYLVDYIRDILSQQDLHHLDIPAQPSITETDSMWHLATPMSAVTGPQATALSLALALHPTPAICGVPRDTALEKILALEENPRSYYSGLVGWMDANGNGRWSLVLRCTQRHQDTLTVYAGAGIVAGSSPEEELHETHAKMQTILRVADTLAPATASLIA